MNFKCNNIDFFDNMCYHTSNDTKRSSDMSEIKYSYNKLWKLLIDKRMMKKTVIEKTGISKATMAKMGREEAVSLDVLAKIALVLDADIGDLVAIDRDYIETENV